MKKSCWAAMVAAVTTMGVSAQATIKEWKFDTQNDLWQVAFHSSPGNEFSRSSNIDIKTPDGQNTLELTITAAKPKAEAHEKQVNFYLDTPLTTTAKYRIEFWCKGSVAGEVSLVVAQGGAPYQILAKNGYKKISVTDQWQKVVAEFMPLENWKCRIAVPRLMPGKYPVGGKLYLGPIRFSQPEKFVAATLNPQWQVFRYIKEPAAASSFKDIPTELPGTSGAIKSQLIKPVNDIIDLTQGANSVKEKNVALLFNEFDSSEAGTMQLGLSADWWMEFAVNGKIVYENLSSGNISQLFQPEDHVINFPIKKGKNLIAVKVISGSKGWKFVAGKVPFREHLNQPTTVIAGKDWKAIDVTKMCIKAGTALDFSSLAGKRRPAGELGRLIVNSDGQAAFAKAPDKPVRLFSFNFCISSWRAQIHTWTKQDIDAFADAVSRQGYSLVRIHFNNRFLLGYKVHNRPLKSLAEAGIPQKVEDILFDAGNCDRFDYLVASLKKRGVYINLDIMTSGTGYTMAYPGIGPSEDNFKTQLLFNPRYRKHWEVVTEYLLNHRNPYTGLCLKDDPSLAIVEPFNEQDLLLYNIAAMKVFTPHFREYLTAKYKNDAALKKAWNDNAITMATVPDIGEEILRRGDARAEDAGRFLIKVMTDMTTWYHDVIRKNGYPGLITQWDMIMRTLEVPVRAKLSAIAQHSYFAHPNLNRIPTKNLVKKSSNWNNKAGNPQFDILISQDSSLNSSYFRSAAAARFLDRPFLITEYSHSAYNRYRHERGLYFGAYAALQGWDSLAAHSDTAAVKTTTYEPFVMFENAMDPISRSSEVIAALAWLRGDVKEAPHTVQLDLSDKAMFPKHFLAAVGDDYAKLAMLTRIGIIYPDVKPFEPVGKAKATLKLPLTEFSPLQVNQWYVSASNADGKVFPELLQKLKDARLLPASNQTNYAKRLFQSETGEITLNGMNKTMTVVTPRLEGAIIKQDRPIKLAKLEISSCSKPASVVVASLDRSKSIDNTKRLLLVLATNALNNGMTFGDSGYCLLAEVGGLPVLMESAKLTLNLKSSQKTVPTIFALNMDGTRAEQIPGELKNGQLALTVDTNTLKYATPFFEIVFP